MSCRPQGCTCALPPRAGALPARRPCVGSFDREASARGACVAGPARERQVAMPRYHQSCGVRSALSPGSPVFLDGRLGRCESSSSGPRPLAWVWQRTKRARGARMVSLWASVIGVLAHAAREPAAVRPLWVATAQDLAAALPVAAAHPRLLQLAWLSPSPVPTFLWRDGAPCGGRSRWSDARLACRAMIRLSEWKWLDGHWACVQVSLGVRLSWSTASSSSSEALAGSYERHVGLLSTAYWGGNR